MATTMVTRRPVSRAMEQDEAWRAGRHRGDMRAYRLAVAGEPRICRAPPTHRLKQSAYLTD